MNKLSNDEISHVLSYTNIFILRLFLMVNKNMKETTLHNPLWNIVFDKMIFNKINNNMLCIPQKVLLNYDTLCENCFLEIGKSFHDIKKKYCSSCLSNKLQEYLYLEY